MRIVLGVEYDGSRYHGWQFQKELVTVQKMVEEALSRVAGAQISTVCAGRTDTGVHATGQVIHFDTEINRDEKAWTLGTNSYLPKDICVHWAKEVNNQFHARFSAKFRKYRYIIHNGKIRAGILRHAVTWHYRHLDETLMLKAKDYFLGEHDFSSFRGADCQSKTPFRYVSHLDIHRHNHFITIDITANSFLHHMVRNIVGVLIAIGENKFPPIWAKEVLEAKSRVAGGITAPPQGLCLVEVGYPDEFSIPAPLNNFGSHS